MKGLKLSNIECLLSAVTELTGISKERIQGKERKHNVVEARYMIIFFLSTVCPSATLQDIGDFMGRNHATIHYARRAYENIYITSPKFRALADMVWRRYRVLSGLDVIHELDMYAIYRPNGEIVPRSIADTESNAWFQNNTMPSGVNTKKEAGWECRGIKVTIKSTVKNIT